MKHAFAGWLQWSAIVISFVSAAVWFWATRVYVVAPQTDPTWRGVGVPTLPDGREIATHATGIRQNLWSAVAASLTGFATLLQALALALGSPP